MGPIWPLVEAFKDTSAESKLEMRKFIEPMVRKALAEKSKRQKDGITLVANEESTCLLAYLADQ